MRVETVLNIIKAIGITIPSDMYKDHKYWSESKKQYREFLDMDIIHVFRVAIKYGMSRKPYYESDGNIFTLKVKSNQEKKDDTRI